MPDDDRAFIPPPLHELESEVMDDVWGHGGEVTVREVLRSLNERSGNERAYTTIMTVMRRLGDKGLLERRRERRTDVYRARMDRNGYLQARAAAEVDAVVELYGDQALVHFARRMGKLDPARRERLRRLSRRD